MKTCFSHVNDFDDLPGHIYFIMTLETCNASTSLDIDSATSKFKDISLSNFPWGENISDLSSTVPKLIKNMNGVYTICQLILVQL